MYIGDNSEIFWEPTDRGVDVRRGERTATATLCTPSLALSAPFERNTRANCEKTELVQSKGARSSSIWLFLRTAALEFELIFEDGFHEAREWLELERLCQESRKKHKAA